jgi:molybdopterin synthase catalytic subunit
LPNQGTAIITGEPISPEAIIRQAKTSDSGCVATYVGLIRDNSHGKPVASVEYADPDGRAASRLKAIADEANRKWPVNNIIICHRVGHLAVGDINLVVAIAAAHREAGFAACQFIVDRFKESLPTQKKETYTDGSVLSH